MHFGGGNGDPVLSGQLAIGKDTRTKGLVLMRDHRGQ